MQHEKNSQYFKKNCEIGYMWFQSLGKNLFEYVDPYGALTVFLYQVGEKKLMNWSPRLNMGFCSHIVALHGRDR